MDPNRNEPPKKPDGDDKKPKSLWTTIFISIAILLAVVSLFNFVDKSKYTETTYSAFLDQMEKGNLEEVEIQHDRIIYMTKEEAAKEASAAKKTANLSALRDWIAHNEMVEMTATEVYNAVPELQTGTLMAVGTLLKDLVEDGTVIVTLSDKRKKLYSKA